jgi:hypothetical protein
MELNMLTYCDFNSVKPNLTEFTAINNLVDMVTMEHNTNAQFSKAHLITFKCNNVKVIETMGLKIAASRFS